MSTTAHPVLAEVSIHRAPTAPDGIVPMFHVTLLSNLARAYDKYKGLPQVRDS